MTIIYIYACLHYLKKKKYEKEKALFFNLTMKYTRLWESSSGKRKALWDLTIIINLGKIYVLYQGAAMPNMPYTCLQN